MLKFKKSFSCLLAAAMLVSGFAAVSAEEDVQHEITRARVNTWREIGCQWGDDFATPDGSILFNGVTTNWWHGRFDTENNGLTGGGAVRGGTETCDPYSPWLNLREGQEEPDAVSLADIDLGVVQTIGRIEIVKRNWNYVHISDMAIYIHAGTDDVWPNGDLIGDRLGQSGVPQEDIDADFVWDGWEATEPSEILGLFTTNVNAQTVTVVFEEPIEARYIRIHGTFSDNRGGTHPPLTYAQVAQIRVFENPPLPPPPTPEPTPQPTPAPTPVPTPTPAPTPSPDATDVTNDYDDYADEEDSDNNLVIIIIVAATVVVIGGIIVLVIAKKKK